jgi:putative ABC transport system permease protein
MSRSTLARPTQPWLEAARIALDAIVSHRLRSALTVMGVIIGVAVVALVAALLEGAQTFIATQAAGLGPGIAKIEKAAFQDFIGDGQAFTEARAKRPDLTLEHLAALRDRLKDRIEIGSLTGANLPVRYGNQSLTGLTIQGVTANIQELSTLRVATGRGFGEFDDQYRRAVCVVGNDAAEFLFPSADPIGKTIKLGSTSSQDAFVQIPLQTFAKQFGSRSRSLGLLARVRAGLAMSDEDLEDALRFGMRQVRRLGPGEADDFSVTTEKKIQAFAGTITKIAAAVLFPLTAIALAVAGIVVMNMMLASVTERTREIGIRKALGARRRDILAQVLVEATMLTVAGGVVGLLIALALVTATARLTGYEISLPLWAAFAALIVSISVGVTFGVFPARRAARLDPIEALRSE